MTDKSFHQNCPRCDREFRFPMFDRPRKVKCRGCHKVFEAVPPGLPGSDQNGRDIEPLEVLPSLLPSDSRPKAFKKDEKIQVPPVPAFNSPPILPMSPVPETSQRNISPRTPRSIGQLLQLKHVQIKIAGAMAGLMAMTLVMALLLRAPQASFELGEPMGAATAANHSTEKEFLQAEAYYQNVFGKDRSRCFPIYKRFAEQGDPKAMGRLSSCYDNGIGIEKNAGLAFEWARRGAQLGGAVSILQLGICYLKGSGVAKDTQAGTKYCEQSAAMGYGEAMNYLGAFYLRSAPDKAYDWFQKGAHSGCEKAMSNLGYCYIFGSGATKNVATAVYWYEKAAALGDGQSMLQLGDIYGGTVYPNSDGVKSDRKLSRSWYEKAAALGDGRAMYRLGGLYRHGTGVPQDSAMAITWYLRSAEAGCPEGMFSLGLLYEQGKGVDADSKAAVFWWEKAAAAGDADAMYNLAACYARGAGVPKDPRKMLSWFEKAYAAGHQKAIVCLAAIHFFGEGVPADERKAVQLLQLGKQAGLADATEFLELIQRSQRNRSAMAELKLNFAVLNAAADFAMGGVPEKGSPCHRCEGRGELLDISGGEVKSSYLCPSCQGTGKNR